MDNARTGIAELSVSDLEKKLGSMAMSTKCCGTGTCCHYSADKTEDKSPRVPKGRDRRSAFRIRKKLGKLAK